jgi:hypothetical protein
MDRHEDATRLERTRKIQELNDRLRKTGIGGKVVLTRAVAAMGQADLSELLRRVRGSMTSRAATTRGANTISAKWRSMANATSGRSMPTM